MIVYCVLSIFSVLSFPDVKERFRAIPENQWRFSRNWMLLLSVVFILASISSLLISIQYIVTEQITVRQMNAGAISLILSISLLMTPVLLIVFPQILYGLPRNINLLNRRTEDKQIAMAPDVFTEQNIAARYAAGQAPDEGPFLELSHRMLKAMEEQKPYLNPEFSLDDLADLLDVPKYHLYYCFQNILHTKFTRLRTAYRIEYSKQLLANTNLQKITLDAVGQQSGFASNSGFYNTFKAEVGCSPGAYAEKHNSTGSVLSQFL